MQKILRSRESILMLILLVLFAGFAIGIEGFFDWLNLLERSRYWVVPGMLAVPMTFIIATAGIDLSVGSILGMSGIILGLLFRDLGWPISLAACAAVLISGLAGAFNGGVSSYLRIPPLVVTLATMALFSGAAMGLSQARPIGNFPASFQWFGQGDLVKLSLGGNKAVSFPVPLMILLLTVIAGWLLMRRSWIGRFTECIGENEIAAEFAAINVRRMKLFLYTASGLIAGLAAVINTAQYATARPDAGKGLELEVIACVVVGGTRISGGRATVIGSLLGLLLIGLLRYGLEMAGVQSQHGIMVVGALLILTAVLNEWQSARAEGK